MVFHVSICYSLTSSEHYIDFGSQVAWNGGGGSWDKLRHRKSFHPWRLGCEGLLDHRTLQTSVIVRSIFEAARRHHSGKDERFDEILLHAVDSKTFDSKFITAGVPGTEREVSDYARWRRHE